MKNVRRLAVLLLLPVVLLGFLSVGYSQIVSDTSLISMGGKDWSLKVDSVLANSVESRNTPYMTSKSLAEKELFLRLDSLADCKSGVVQFKIDMVGLTVYKQLPLDKELTVGKEYAYVNVTHALDEKGNVLVHRPIEIVNSFACFDSDGRKVLHIYASKIVDAKGVEVWLDQDLVDGLLTVYLPDSNVFEGLSFPLLLDPTFGYSTTGASEQYPSADEAITNQVNMTGAFSLSGASILCDGFGAYNLKPVFWYQNGSVAAIGDIVVGSQGLLTWVSSDFASESFSAGTYYYGVIGDAANYVMRYDADAAQKSVICANNYTNPAALTSVTNGTKYFTMLFYYSDVATPSPSPSPSATPIVNGDLTDTEWFVSALLLVLVVVNIVLLAFPFALVRFVFGTLSLALSAIAFTFGDVPLAPYLQMMGLVVSVVCMFLATRARE